ncbi:MAG: hypothetical protein EOS72_24700 [Mesorhizobium sp.]|uniref:hypothetical protein n=1 Tax=Mesorhizobium sp. TaxID=1871066 RepID=UPI000FE84815|nr:hypothetical protein [Mesorhizobium sp.]RWC86770.1 MAG: hypothetical protein EOS72_24700 [Mesorhizobium sp.]
MSISDRTKPSLDDARSRIDRAKQHIASLEDEIVAVIPPNRTITAAAPGGSFMGGGTQLLRVPPILPILIGEAIYNLRAALDYLVFELAYLDTGTPKSGTKFLIEPTEKGWNNHLTAPTGKERRKLWLPELTAAHQAALKRLQPCYGCKWTGTLRDLSNPDKHRRLLGVVATIDQLGYGAIPGGGAVMVTFQLTTKVAFEDASPVVETLKLLQEQVADVIEAFDPDFG